MTNTLYQIIADKRAVIHGGSRLSHGQTLELSDADGERLVRLGCAVRVTEEVQATEPKAKKSKKATEQVADPEPEPELSPSTAEIGEGW